MTPRVSRTCILTGAVLLGSGALGPLGEASPPAAHGSEARFVVELEWPRENIARTLGVARSELGMYGRGNPFQTRDIGDRTCVVGPLFALDIEDGFAFDIDEPVDLVVTYAPELTGPFSVGFNDNGGDGIGASETIEPESGPGPGAATASTLATARVTLDRARFAAHGIRDTDLAIGGPEGIALCDIEVVRSHATPVPAGYGTLRLTVEDAASGRSVPARFGLYDETGRAPLPSERSVLVHRFVDEVRLLWVNPRTWWPSEHRLAFYVDGEYEARLPAGSYELVATRGPEYRGYQRTIEVRADETTDLTVSLERYADLPAQGWYSGDSHVHIARDHTEDDAVWAQIAAEDIHVANLLEMGNIAVTHFKQPAWGEAGQYVREGHALVSGQEDPRTVQRGHTIHHNLQRPIRQDPESYFLYHRVFEESHAQGGISGYAHMGQLFNGERGLALDVPFDLVDFIEVLQGGRLYDDIWYSFLNLGFNVRPIAGADYPYFGPTLPGVERTYVKLDGPFAPNEWYNAYRSGHTYVSNGPFLEFQVNGREMGSELRVVRGENLEIVARTSLNPDIDRLNRLELVVHGEVVASVTRSVGDDDGLRLATQIEADESLWVAVRAYGDRDGERDMTVAHSAPVFVVVDDEPWWKLEAVPELVARHRAKLQELLTAPIQPAGDLEYWETTRLLEQEWEQQRFRLEPRVQEADARYQALLDRARAATTAFPE
ncbi:CehA/McbA family metallohydrolase [Candidatus Palauibacter sp.]|uniref:CehA/McbA family metallohydrolase n=1 Tax=Candidatus Palauibacter sp. TaxID=3101350 RepID=UPI003B52D575